MKKIINSINLEENLEMNLPAYADKLSNLYYKNAWVDFTMEFYTLYESLENKEKEDKELNSTIHTLNNIIMNYILENKVDAQREQGIKLIDELRNIVFNKVNGISSYVDIFTRYEYISNRCEYLIKDDSIDKNYSDEEFTKEIMQYIFSNEDNTAINERISEIVGELPIRITKNKFYQLLSDGLSVYEKTDKETIDSYIGFLKTFSLVKTADNLSDFIEFQEIYNYIKSIDYSTIDKETFEKLENSLCIASNKLEKLNDIYMQLQGIINKAYVIIINKPYIQEDKVIINCRDITKRVSDLFLENKYITLEDDVIEKFVELEGIPEHLRNEISKYEYVLDTVKNKHLSFIKSIMCDKIYQGLFLSQCLLSDSLFIDLEKSINSIYLNKETETIDLKQYASNERDKFILELKDLFSNNQKIFNKSIMAIVLSKLPVFFNNVEEIQDYIYNSLNNCTNKSEKKACIEIIKTLLSY